MMMYDDVKIMSRGKRVSEFARSQLAKNLYASKAAGAKRLDDACSLSQLFMWFYLVLYNCVCPSILESGNFSGIRMVQILL